MIEYRDAEGKDERLARLAVELVALNVDVIVAAAGTLAAVAAREATRTLPIVFIAVGAPVTSGLVSSLARPGGNVTGLSAVSPDLASKWLELLKQAVPGVSRVAFLRQPGALGDGDKDVLKQAEVAARALGVRFQLVEARGPADCGVSPAVGVRWFREACGMAASHLMPSAPPPSGRYLAFTDREQIALWRAQGHGVREIARRLARAPSTISRELRRTMPSCGGTCRSGWPAWSSRQAVR